MIPFSPAMLVAAACAFTGLEEDRSAATRGALVRALLRQVGMVNAGHGADQAPWDTAFVHHAGFWSHFDSQSRASSWPLPPLPTPELLGEFAKASGVIEDAPEHGDVFLLHGPARGGFVRAGIIVDVVDVITHQRFERSYDCVTIEGDTDQAMSLRGGMVLWHRRRLSATRKDAFVRWTKLPHRRVPVQPIAGAVVDVRDVSPDAEARVDMREPEAA